MVWGAVVNHHGIQKLIAEKKASVRVVKASRIIGKRLKWVVMRIQWFDRVSIKEIKYLSAD